jgi:hypothetical protein
MPEQLRSERRTQNRVVALVTNKARSIGLDYPYLDGLSPRNKIRAPKKGMMQELLTGRTRLV